MTAGRPLALTAVVPALFGSGLVLASRGGDDEPVATTETTTTTRAEQQTTTAQTVDPGPRVVTVLVENGAPKGGIARKTVETGDRVVLIVRSDVADHVHLHGCHLTRAVTPGTPVRLALRAAIPGQFEVELEDRGLQTTEITVTP